MGNQTRPHHLSTARQVLGDVVEESVGAVVLQGEHGTVSVDLDAHGRSHPLQSLHKVLRLVSIAAGGQDHEVVQRHRGDEVRPTHATRPVSISRLVA